MCVFDPFGQVWWSCPVKRPKQSGGPDLADAPPAVLSNPRLIKVEMPFSSAVHKHRVIYTLPPPPRPQPPFWLPWRQYFHFSPWQNVVFRQCPKEQPFCREDSVERSKFYTSAIGWGSWSAVGAANKISNLYQSQKDLFGIVWQNWIFRPKTEILGPKKHTLLNSNHVLATTGKSCSKKKVAFSQINISLLRNFGWFFGLKPIFGQKNTFRPNIKTAVSP